MKYILLIFFLQMAMSLLYAKVRIAKVKTSIAVVYKDSKLKVPFGYIRRGRKIRISSNIHRNKKVYPVLIENTISYIQKKDIEVLNRDNLNIKKIYEHNIDQAEMNLIEKNVQNSSALLSYGTGEPGAGWNNLSKFMGDKNTANLKTYSFNLIYHPPRKTFSIGVGIKKISLDQRSVSLDSLLGSLSFFWDIYRYKNILLVLESNFMLSGDVQVNSSSSKTPSRGIAIGGRIGISARFFPESKWGTTLGLFTQKINFSELEPIKNESGDEYYLKEISGTSILAGITYHF